MYITKSYVCNYVASLPKSVEFGNPLITKFGEFSAKCLQVDSSLSKNQMLIS